MADSNIKIVIDYITNGAKESKAQAEGMKEAIRDFTGATTLASKVSGIFKNAVNGIKKASQNATGTLQKFTKSLGRIFLYRTVRKILSETAQAFKEGAKNIYAYSQAIGNADASQVSKNLDSLATSILYVKNCLGSILAPVIQFVTPLVYQMSDAFASASRSIAQVFAILGGAGVGDAFTYAKRFGTQFSDSLASASGSAKEIKRTLMGFDEINRLDDPTDSSGGGGATTIDASQMFDEGTITSKAKKIADIIKKIILPVIATLGSAMAGIFVASKISGFVSGIAQCFGATEKFASAIGKVVGGVTLIVAGLGLIVYGVMDVINTGGSLKSWCAILGGIALVVMGVALAFGGIPALITGIVLVVGALGLFITKNWDDIKTKGHEVIESVKQKLSELWQKILSIPIIGKIAEVVGKVFEAIVSVWQKIQEIKAKIWEIFIALGKVFYTYALKPIIDWLLKGATWVYDHVIKPIIDFLTPIGVAVGDFIGGAVKSVLNAVFTTLERGINGFIRMLNGAIKLINNIPDVNISKVTEISIPRLATGGFVGQGQLFVANEMGAEMVGSMNGKTTVANNQQIVEGIKQGVLQAMQQANGSQNIVLNVDGKQLFDIMVGRNNSIVRTSGRSPLLV